MLQPTDDDEAIISKFLMSFLSSNKTYPIAELSCTINRTSSSASSSLVARNEMMAWAGVQIYCHCSLDDTKVRFMKDEGDSSSSASDSFSSSDTSFNPCKNEKGHVIFSTQTKILFCMLSLAPNESKTFIYSEQIPSHAPPSYYGSAVKYLYKLTIGTQRVKEGIQLLKIPLRILQITPEIQKGLDLCLTSKINQIDLDEREDDRKGDKEKQQQQEELSEEDMLNLVIDQLDSLTARKNSNSYVITNQSGQVAKFCLLKSSFKLGEDVIGIFNFSEATVPCVQVSIERHTESKRERESHLKSHYTLFREVIRFSRVLLFSFSFFFLTEVFSLLSLSSPLI